MNISNSGARAISAYEIADVFLVESNCWVSREFNQTQQLPEIIYGHKSGVEPEGLVQTRTLLAGGEPIHILRYFIRSEVGFLKPGTEVVDGQEPDNKDLLAVLKFVFAADYRCPPEVVSDKDAASAFSYTAYFHTWPYLREEVHAACSRLRLPRTTLPMLKPDQPEIIKMSKGTSSQES